MWKEADVQFDSLTVFFPIYCDRFQRDIWIILHVCTTYLSLYEAFPCYFCSSNIRSTDVLDRWQRHCHYLEPKVCPLMLLVVSKGRLLFLFEQLLPWYSSVESVPRPRLVWKMKKIKKFLYQVLNRTVFMPNKVHSCVRCVMKALFFWSGRKWKGVNQLPEEDLIQLGSPLFVHSSLNSSKTRTASLIFQSSRERRHAPV